MYRKFGNASSKTFTNPALEDLGPPTSRSPKGLSSPVQGLLYFLITRNKQLLEHTNTQRVLVKKPVRNRAFGIHRRR
jgi:hypothetical protein